MTTRKEIADRVDMLISGLAALKAQRDAAPADGDDQQYARTAAHLSLATVINFLASVPEWRTAKLDFGLYPLLLAIEQIDQGGVVSWLSNGKPRPPVPMEIKAGRGRCAGVMDVLMSRADYKRRPAAEFVVRNLNSGVLQKMGATSRTTTWGTVASWRDNVMGSPSDKFAVEQDGFRFVVALADRNRLPWPTFAKRVLAGISRHTERVTFESTPV